MNISKLCKSSVHKWFEAIDIDSGGNLYFTDNFENALYRIKRNKKDNTLPHEEEEKLLWGFKHAGGVSIDRKNDALYLGVRSMENKGKILQIPLETFNEPYKGCEYSSNSFKKALEHDIPPKGINLPVTPRPNGVLFEPDTRTTFYTHEDLFGNKGYLGNTSNLEIKRLITPNGIDVDPTAKDLTLVISLTRRNRIIRLNLATGEEISKELKHEKKFIFGLGPDGVFCLENGDMLFASFLSGRVYHLPRNGQSYDDPRMIADGLNQPTDLVIGPSSSGRGESLFVTSTSFFRVFLGGDGNVFEIPNIREKIKSN